MLVCVPLQQKYTLVNLLFIVYYCLQNQKKNQFSVDEPPWFDVILHSNVSRIEIIETQIKSSGGYWLRLELRCPWIS